MRNRLLGAAALLLLIGIVVGLPWVLMTLGQTLVDLPDRLPTLSDIITALTRPDDGSLIVIVLLAIGWAAWAFLTLSIVVETAAQLRGVRAPRLPGLRVPQNTARGLVAAAALLFVAVPTAANAAPMTPLDPPPPSSSQQVATQHSNDQQTREAPSEDTTQASAGTTRYTVRHADSLWKIAEQQLGDGERYTEIAQLNYDRPQNDGHTLTPDHWLNPGWELLIPATADVQPASQDDSTVTHTVGEDETLWDIAEEHLGDGERYPEIVQATADLPQPGGVVLTDPDEISPGWTLLIPTSDTQAAERADDDTSGTDSTQQPDEPPEAEEPAQAPAAEEEQSQVEAPPPAAEATPVPTTPVPQPGERQHSSPEAGAPEAGDETSSSDDLEVDQVVRTAAGVGAIMAAGVISLVGVRRHRQQRLRRPGHRLPMPDVAAARTEQQMRAAADPMTVELVDQALRRIAQDCRRDDLPLPGLRAGRLTANQFELYLDAPTPLPAPWKSTDDPAVWTVAATDITTGDDLSDVPAPYPALVTLGHDSEDGHLFLDLEYVGSLNLDSGQPADILRGLAIELATSRWADDLQVTLVGFGAELEDALQTGRVRYVPTVDTILSELESRAEQDRSDLDDHGAQTVGQARRDRVVPHAWIPEVLLIAGALTQRQQNLLTTLTTDLPRVSIAAVTTDTALGPWQVHVHDDHHATLDPIGLPFTPQLVTDATYADILDIGLSSSEDEPGTVAAVVALPAPTRAHHPEFTVTLALDDNQATVSAPGDVEPKPQPEGHHPPDATAPSTSAPTTAEDDQEGSPPVPQSTADAPPAHDPEAADSGAVTPLTSATPIIRILGRPDIAHATGTVEPAKRNRLLEYAIYLALHRDTTHTDIDDAIWPNRRSDDNLNTRNTATSKLRKWIGTAPDGSPYLPRNSYRLHDAVRTDWDEFKQLVGSDPQGASTAQLRQALDLVNGKPFAGVHRRHYTWAEPIRQEIISAIVDAANELGRRHLINGEWRAAEICAAHAINLEPGVERAWRLRILAAHEARAGVDEAVDRLLLITDQLGCDLEDETIELLDALKSPAPVLHPFKEAL